jgi:phage terminase large subunit GpA-like protein
VGQKGKPPLGKPTKVDINFSGKALKRGVQLFPVGVDVIKTTLHNRLRDSELGEGYIHFYPTITSDYFEELTAERQVLRYKHGYQERVWVKKSDARNEALDEMVYAYAAFQRFQQKYDRRTIWEQLEKRRDPKEPKQGTPLRSGRQKSTIRRNFVGNW